MSTSTPTVAVSSEKPKARESLSEAEAAELQKQEKLLAAGFKSIRDCASALRVIRDKKLYRGGFDSFEEYCEAKWHRERTSIFYLLKSEEQREEMLKIFNMAGEEKAAELVQDLSASGVRELVKVEPGNRIKVFEQAVQQSNGEPPTAQTIRSFIDAGLKASKAVEAELGLTGESTKPKKSRRNSRRGRLSKKELMEMDREEQRFADSISKPRRKRGAKPPSKDNAEAHLSDYDEWQDARAARWQKDFGARAWRAYNAQVFEILREVRGWWENRIKAEFVK